MIFLYVLILAYLLGSIPFGLILTRLAGHGDIRFIGAGNGGATNVLRTGNKSLALATLILDVGKGSVAVLIADYAYPEMGQFAGLAALLGHMFPVWLVFKGGKGVSTSLGILLPLAWPVALSAAGVWLMMAFRFRYSSLSALTATAIAPALAWMFGYPHIIWLLAIIAVLIFIKHRDNVRRLLDGTETKIGQNNANAP